VADEGLQMIGFHDFDVAVEKIEFHVTDDQLEIPVCHATDEQLEILVCHGVRLHATVLWMELLTAQAVFHLATIPRLLVLQVAHWGHGVLGQVVHLEHHHANAE